jgi:hypothetical protein
MWKDIIYEIVNRPSNFRIDTVCVIDSVQVYTFVYRLQSLDCSRAQVVHLLLTLNRQLEQIFIECHIVILQ